MKDVELFGGHVKIHGGYAEIHGVRYKLQFDTVEVHQLNCTRCKHPVELHNGWGELLELRSRFNGN